MIELRVEKKTNTDGATEFHLSPECVNIGGKGACCVDRLRISLPEEWAGMTVRITFIPFNGERVAFVLDDKNEVDIVGAMSANTGAGAIVIDATDGNGYVAYSTGSRFCTYEHPDAGGDYTPTPTEYEQLVALVTEERERAEAAAEKAIAEMEFVCIVTELPEIGTPNKTYFVTKTDGAGNDIYDEYMWVNDAWEYIGTKTIEVDLTDYVKNTDFPDPKNFKAGVVRVDNYYGFNVGQAGSAGVLLPLWASNAEIDSKSDRRFINAKNFDYALAKSLTTNTETLTDAEKEAAQKWIGVKKATNEAKPYTFVERSANGVIYTGTPTEAKHATTKEYVDGLAVERKQGVVTFENDGTQNNIQWHYNAMGGTIARRMGNGTLWVATPDHDSAAANKAYVDAATPFIAEYGVTTHDEITAAVDAGRACFCLIKDGTYKGRVVPLSYIDATWATFSTIVTAGSPNTVGIAQELSVWCINSGVWTDVKTKALAYKE